MNDKKSNLPRRFLLYLAGLVILALGLTLNTKTTLGVSPIISVSYAISEISHRNLGDVTFVWYSVLVVIQLILLLIMKAEKKALGLTVLQLPLSLVFTRFMNLFSAVLPVFATAYAGSPLGSLVSRILFLLLAIVLTGIGAAMSLDAHLIPNPGDGIVQAIASFTKKSVGLSKNFVDITCVVLAVLLSLLLTRRIIGVGIGTLLAALLTGRVIALYHKLAGRLGA